MVLDKGARHMTPVTQKRNILEVNLGQKMVQGSPLASPTVGKKFLATSLLANVGQKILTNEI
jgi:hypothetical protein